MAKTPQFPSDIEKGTIDNEGRVYVKKPFLKAYAWLESPERVGWGWLYVVNSRRLRVLSDEDMRSNDELLETHTTEGKIQDDPHKGAPPFHVRDKNAAAIRSKRLIRTHILKGDIVKITIPESLRQVMRLSTDDTVVLVADSRGFLEIWTWDAVRDAYDE
ncbi:MAG TPA: hypothetical protein VGL91_03150 [Acidobacteriota bacterium]|jgi:hypothetical protein